MHLNEETYVSSQRININNKDKRIYKLKENWETWREGIRVCIDVKNNGTKGGEKRREAIKKKTLSHAWQLRCEIVALREKEREKMGLAEGDPFPIRVSPQAFNHPIKRIFTYVN